MFDYGRFAFWLSAVVLHTTLGGFDPHTGHLQGLGECTLGDSGLTAEKRTHNLLQTIQSESRYLSKPSIPNGAQSGYMALSSIG